ncbi:MULTISPECIES: cation:proton antiporter [Aphanothece]|uniref:cation:proton antiporter n=1 Tax=Aphanothece TaxID=1121 RepID=UPI0039852F90
MIQGYLQWAVLAIAVLGYALLSGRLGKTPLSGSLVFLVAGWLLGPDVLGWLNIQVESENLRTITEFTLALILFTDAANAQLSVLRDLRLPVRLLGLGLPLSIVLGALLAGLIFPAFTPLEACLLGVCLAPTDAALGQPVVTNPRVPPRIREDLSVESGLNDGICVPFLLFLLSLAAGQGAANAGAAKAGMGQLGTFFVGEIGGGVLVGVAVCLLGCAARDACSRRGWIAPDWRPVLAVAMAMVCFTLAQLIGGSGFIACFCGGLLFGGLTPRDKEEELVVAEGTGDVLSVTTWLIFGAAVFGRALEALTPANLLYAVLSLTLVRMLPVAVATLGLKLHRATTLFVGWFGPRGLASIVFAVILLDAGLPHGNALADVIAITVTLSVLAHGLSAQGLAERYGRMVAARTPS